MCVATMLFLNKRNVTNLNLAPERLLLGCLQEGVEEEEEVVEGELLQEQGQAQEEEGEAEGVGEAECWVGTVDLKHRCKKCPSAHKRPVNTIRMRQWKVRGCGPGPLLSSEKKGRSGMLCMGPDGAKPGPRSAL